MTTCAIVLSRNNADTVEGVLRHLLWHCDEVAVTDHRSDDGAREIAESLPVRLTTVDSAPFPGDAERTRLALEALERGHEWAVVVDADEIWAPLDLDARISDWLDAFLPSIWLVEAAVYDHVPTAEDRRETEDPLRRIRWRRRERAALKYAGRLRPDLVYAGHGFRYPAPTTIRSAYGLVIHHFSVRTADQLVVKVRNCQESHGVDDPGLTAWKGLSDEEIRARFYQDFWKPEPDDEFEYDPAPVRRAP